MTKTRDIFHYEKCRPKFRDEPKEIEQKIATRIVCLSKPDLAEALTWWATKYPVDVPDTVSNERRLEARQIRQQKTRARKIP